jgi:putative membrane protein
MFGGLMMLIFWGVILALIVMAVRWFTSGRPGGTQPRLIDRTAT